MQFNFVSKNFDIDDRFKKFTMDKINSHLSRLLPEDTNINIRLIEVGFEKKAEVTLYLKKRIIRAEATSDINMHESIDKVVDILKKRIRRYKSRINRLSKGNSHYQEEARYVLEFSNNDDSHEENKINHIERTKSFAVKPMDPEEASMEMELLGHSFYVFLNSQTNEVNVIYKRQNGSYGLIEPKV